MSEERRRRLEKLGFDWKVIEMSPWQDWEARFRQLREFKRRFGHCAVPGKWRENIPLANWVSRQKRDRAELTAEQRRRLESLGLARNWREEKWERMFQKLVEYRRKHGTVDVPYKSPESELRRWVLHHRYDRERLTPERIVRLDKLGLTWRPKHKEKAVQR